MSRKGPITKEPKASETKLGQFSSCFKTEADLRLALIALLEKLPNTWGVKHTHGTLEKGKDIVSNRAGHLQLKNLWPAWSRIRRSQGPQTLTTVLGPFSTKQKRAFDTPILNSQGEEAFAHSYVITPYDCSQAAIDSIKAKLANPEGAVRFLFGRELYELFERYYPDYLVFRSGLFGTYISDLESGISNDSAVANLLMKHGLSGKNHDISKIYVEPILEVRISQFHLLTEWPELPSPTERVLEQEVVELGYRYIAFGQFMEVVADDDESKAFQGHMQWLAKSLRTLWKEAYKEHNRGTSSLYRSERPAARRVGLSLPTVSHLKEIFEQRVPQGRAILDEFHRKLARANMLAASKPATFDEFLSHPARLDYSYIRGIAAQLPSLIDEAVLASVTVNTTSKKLMDSGEDALITAPAGFGKTSFCRWNVLNDLKDLKEEHSKIIPILIPLHQVAIDEGTTATDLFFSSKSLAEMWSSRTAPDTGKVLRRFRLYLDGLDEVPDHKKQRAIMRLASDLKALEPTVHIVLTGREHVAGSHPNTMSRLHVAEMNDAQINELFDQWFSDFGDRKAAFKKQLEAVPSIKQVMSVPLLATLVLSVYESTSTLPESRIRLYDMFIALMAGGWDVAKRVHRETQFGPQPKTTVLQYLAGRLQLNESREASRSQFSAAVRILLPALEARSTALLEEIVHDGLLVPVAGGYAFSHLSFQEYLAAKDLMEPRGTKASEALGRYLNGNQWWKEVLSFYVALSGQPKEMENFIRGEALKVARKSPDRQILQKTIGLLKEIAVAYPGAQPSLEFPQWPKGAAQFWQPPLPNTATE